MDDIKNFEAFYLAKIAPQITFFKKQDKEAGMWGVVMVLALIFTLVSFILTIHLKAEWHGSWVTTLLFIFSIFSIYTYTKNEDIYTNNFKEGIIKEIIKYLHPDLIYKAHSMVSVKEYRQSGLYRS
jgi:succinate-acetate transporter protein